MAIKRIQKKEVPDSSQEEKVAPAPTSKKSVPKSQSLQLPSDLKNRPIIAHITTTLSEEEQADVQRDPVKVISRKSPHLLSREALIKEVEEKGSNSAGKKEYLKFLRGEQISLKESQRAKCYDCMAWFIDGRADCKDVNCPSYPYFIYNKTDTSQRKRKKIDPTWLYKKDDINMDENSVVREEEEGGLDLIPEDLEHETIHDGNWEEEESDNAEAHCELQRG